MWRALLLYIVAVPAAGQQGSVRDDAKALLLEVCKKVMLTVNRLPRYTCTETIHRSTFRPRRNVASRSCDDLASLRKKTDWKVREETSDRLRLDVALSDRVEMFSWAGEARFHDRSLADLVRRGPTLTGTFVSFLNTIFGTNAAVFTYNGEVITEGRPLVEFGFHVPLDNSHYRLENNVSGAIVAYDGTFLADPQTFDLVHLSIRASGIPAQLAICEDVTTLNYGNLRFHDSEFLLPLDVRLHLMKIDGTELENRTVFSSCHEFQSESSLSFDPLPDNRPVTPPPNTVSKALALPAGLPFRLAITYPIDTATAAAGDPIRAKLTTSIKEKRDGVLVPKGAALTGRIVQMERHYGPDFESLTLAFRLETVEVNGVSQPFDASLGSAVRGSSRALDPEDLGSPNRLFDPKDPSVGFPEFQDVSRNFVISPGVEITGTTTTPK